jgi:hypothetical protein
MTHFIRHSISTSPDTGDLQFTNEKLIEHYTASTPWQWPILQAQSTHEFAQLAGKPFTQGTEQILVHDIS